MAEWRLGDEHEDVATIQRWLYRLYNANPGQFKNPGTNWGVMDADTVAALKAFQRSQRLPQTGTWDSRTRQQSRNFTKFVTKGKTSNPWDSNQGIGSDRAYVVKHFEYVYGRKPTTEELNRHVSYLQRGQNRATWSRNLEKHDAPATVARIYKETLGREPTPYEVQKWAAQISQGRLVRAELTKILANTPEGLLREKETEAAEGQEDARAYINELLDEMGLGDLKDWAWDLIKKDYSEVRIMQELRKTDTYKVRFAGNVERVAAGLPAMSEVEYLAYEEATAQLFRQMGMPAELQSREVYASLVAGNVSLAELNERVQEGFARVANAPPEIRGWFTEKYGIAGDANLATYFLDPDLATPILRKQMDAAAVGGIGRQFGMEFSLDRAEQIAGAGVGEDEARAGLSQLAAIDPLFTESVSESLNLDAEEQGADAVFQLGGPGQLDIQRRQREREASLSGGGGASVTNRGIGVGASD